MQTILSGMNISMARKIKLSVIVPCYNEAKNIPLVLERFSDALNNWKLPKELVELILVNNNSKDNSAQVLTKELKKKKNSFAKIVFEGEPGYGTAIYKGLTSARGEFICWTHADLQTDPKDILRGLDIIKNQSKFVKVYVKGKRYGRPLFDSFFTFGMSIFETSYMKKLLYDINAQPNLFHHSLLRLMTSPPRDFSFDLYAYYLAKKNGYKIIRFPVLLGKRIHGKSTWNSGIKSRIQFIKRTISFSIKLKRNIQNAA